MVAYLSTVLKQNNYHASTDPVTTTTWTTTAPSVLTATLPQGVTVSFDEGTQFIAARYSASGNVVAPITALAAIVDTCSYDAVPAGAGTIAVVAWCVPCVHDAVPAAAVTDATTCAEAVRPRPGGGISGTPTARSPPKSAHWPSPIMLRQSSAVPALS